LLACAFTNLNMFKPATSKESNSEVYVVAQGLVRSGWLCDILSYLKDGQIFGKFPKANSMFSIDDIPNEFFNCVRQCAKFFMSLQENVIMNHLHYWRHPMSSVDLEIMSEIQTEIAETYLKKYKVSGVSKDRFCVDDSERKWSNVSQIDLTTYRGNSSWDINTEKTLVNIKSSVKEWKTEGDIRFINWVSAPVMGKFLDVPVMGQKLDQVLNSKFCTGRHLQYYHQTIHLTKHGEKDMNKAKKRKVDDIQDYQGSCVSMEACKEKFETVIKMAVMFPEIVPITKVILLYKTYNASSLSSGCMTKKQKILIKIAVETILDFRRGQHLLVSGLALFTRLDIAIFYCIASLFEETGFVKPEREEDFIFFSNFLGDNAKTEKSISSLESILSLLSSPPSRYQILSVWSMKDLVQDHIYSEIILFNQRRIKEKILYLTQ